MYLTRDIILQLWLMYIMSLTLFLSLNGEDGLSETNLLMTFRQSIDPTMDLLTSWNGTESSCCSGLWLGITCNLETHSVTQIRLENQKLRGRIDALSLCKLISLQVLNLAGNYIEGNIPEELSDCKSMTHLNLSNNRLRGRIPRSLSAMSELQSLDISNNNFSGYTDDLIMKRVGSRKHAEFRYGLKKPVTISKFLKASESLNALSQSPLQLQKGPPPPPPPPPKEHKMAWYNGFAIMLLVIATFILLMLILRKKRDEKQGNGKKIEKEDIQESPIKILMGDVERESKKEEEQSELVSFVEESERFKMEDLLGSTAELHGQSLCSSLYKVTFRDGTLLAVKRLKKLQVTIEEFGGTMLKIGNLKHPNILPLVGYHCSRDEMLLIYRYQKHGSLLSLLENYVEGNRDFPWSLRLSIACGIVRGLDYLYREAHMDNVPHGNLKPSNIFLDENEEPCISEYGFQHFFDPRRSCLYSSNGYRAPERKVTQKSDVYSFGVILLEFLTGKTVAKSGVDLPKWVKSMVSEEWTGEVFDKEVAKAGKQWAFPLLNVALRCVSKLPENRPNITEVLEKIEEAERQYEDNSSSSASSIDSDRQDGCLLHTVIPEAYETPGSYH
ncbi:hypothetical protein AMTRI_Chr10g230290 [Amborella trichopoda]